MIIKEDTHPCLWAAFKMIRADNGSYEDVPSVELPSICEENIETAEKALITLTDKEFVEFCYGEKSVQDAFIARSQDLRIADLVLSAYFEKFDGSDGYDPDDE